MRIRVWGGAAVGLAIGAAVQMYVGNPAHALVWAILAVAFAVLEVADD